MTLKIQSIAIGILIITVALHLFGIVNTVPIILAAVGLMSLWLIRIEELLGHLRINKESINVAWGNGLWTFRIGNHVTEMAKEKVIELHRMLGDSLDTDVG